MRGSTKFWDRYGHETKFFCSPTVREFHNFHLPISVWEQQLTFCQTWTEFGGVCCFWRFREKTGRERWVFQPAEGLGGGRVVQGSTACLVRLVDLSASAHQGHSALVPPISSRIVQRCPKGRMQGERIQSLRILTCIRHHGNGTSLTVTALAAN